MGTLYNHLLPLQFLSHDLIAVTFTLFPSHVLRLKLNFLFSLSRKKKGNRKMADEGTATCIDIILAIILPPLGVFLKFGCKVMLNIYLTFPL
jgi:hypothetical protein